MKIQKTIIAALFCLALITCTSSQTAGKADPFFFNKYAQTIRPASGNKSTANAKMELTFYLTDSKQADLAKVIYSALYGGLTPGEYANKVTESSKNVYLEETTGLEIDPDWIEIFQWEYEEEHSIEVTGPYAVITRKIYEFLGGAHGYTGISTHVINTGIPELLSLNDIISRTGFSSLMPLVMRELRLYSEQETGQHMGPNDPLSSGGLYLVDDIELRDWYPTKEGLCFFWNPYDISHYAAGHIFVKVSWNNLRGILGSKGAMLAGAYE